MLSESTIKRLEVKQEELAELFLEQASIEEWRDLSTKDRRGDTYWLKKNAAQTLGLMVRIQSLLNMHLVKPGGSTPPPDEEPSDSGSEAIAAQAEKDAIAVIDRVRRRTGKK